MDQIRAALDVQNRLQDKRIMRQIESYVDYVARVSQDEYAIQDAKELVPVAELVQDNLNILEGNYKDNLLPLVTHWFKNKFFKWFKPPNCDHCNIELSSDLSYANQEGNTVEKYRCNTTNCQGTSYDFIRHNDPAILLNTRQGRCGEWANCFFTILRALDYDARLVFDTTDHIWNEVWSETRSKWLHVDPCENVIDNPLLYELGWGKKLEFCIAVSTYEVVDVTRRYSSHFAVTKTRRWGIDETKLSSFLEFMNENLILKAPVERREEIRERRQQEDLLLSCFEAMGLRTADDTNLLDGRTTGDLEWLKQRGELPSKRDNQDKDKGEGS